jgi:hypothetical protein
MQILAPKGDGLSRKTGHIVFIPVASLLGGYQVTRRVLLEAPNLNIGMEKEGASCGDFLFRENSEHQKLNRVCSCTVLLPSAAPAIPKFELGINEPSLLTELTVLSMESALMFVLLNRL